MTQAERIRYLCTLSAAQTQVLLSIASGLEAMAGRLPPDDTEAWALCSELVTRARQSCAITTQAREFLEGEAAARP